MVEGYWIAVRAKPLQIVYETFFLVPTDGANCGYLDHLIFEASTERRGPIKKGLRWRCGCLDLLIFRASVEGRGPAKNGVRWGVSVTFSMI